MTNLTYKSLFVGDLLFLDYFRITNYMNEQFNIYIILRCFMHISTTTK